jgi:SpoVK/Ycf46/Vps4 family AAA+-type ATPase
MAADPSDGTVGEALLQDGIAQLSAALLAGSRGVLVVGSDALSRRAVASAAAPHARVTTCDDSAVGGGLRREMVILTAADAPEANKHVRAALAKHGSVIAIAAKEEGVASGLRRAGRLESVVRLRPPSFAARSEAWKFVLEVMQCGSADNEEAVCALAAASPAFGLGDVRSAVQLALSQIGDLDEEVCGSDDDNGRARSDLSKFPEVLLDIVRETHPQSAAGLDFVTYGTGLIDRTPPSSKSPSRTLLKPSVPWAAVGGYAEVKQQIERLVHWPVMHLATFKRLGVEPPRGLLLHGPSGCGKTLLATNLLSSLHTANWMRVDGPALFSRYLGDSEARVRAVFAQARSLEPCIVFIDELEAIGGARGDDESVVERRVLGALLAEIDGAAAGRVFVLACTNQIAAVDPALIRSGRIDGVIAVGRPDREDRAEILHVLTKSMRIGKIQGGRVGDHTEVSENEEDDGAESLMRAEALSRIAELADGFSGADLSRLCREAAMCAMRECEEPNNVEWRHFDDALEAMSSR